MRVGIAATVRRTIPEFMAASARHFVLAAAALVLFSAHAGAQVCRDDSSNAKSGGSSGSSDKYFVNCDMTYKNTELMCDTNAVRGSCPAEPMMMKETPNRSIIKGYSPYLYAYARDPEDKSRPYTGPFYRGTPGDATQTFGLVCPPGRKCPASCSAQLKFPREAKSPEEEAKMVRLQLDNCANQYILNSARFPQQKEGSSLLCNEDSTDGSKRCSLKSSCQPLKTVLETKNDYFPTAYLRAAWIKVMQDPSYRMNRRAALEPHLPNNIRIENPIPPPTPFEDVRLSQIGSVPYEEINDPTHPFSPRWDFEYNERDRFSPLTKGYGGDEKNEVFCAGDKDEQILKVDVMRFRDDRLDFSDKVTQRITWNQNCKDNSGMQANPCCMIQDYYNCKLLPCSQCYGMTDSSPVCSTDYVRTPDRKKVKIPYLPVHPILRVSGMMTSMSNMSLSSMGGAMSSAMGGAMNVAQATSMISSMSSMMGSISSLSSMGGALGSMGSLGSLGANGLSLGQAMPMLGIQSNVLGNIPTNINASSLGSLFGTQTNLLGNLSGNLSMSQLQGVFSGQNLSLSALGGAVGLPTNQIMQALNSPRGLLNTVAASTPLGDLQQDLRQQMNLLQNFSSMSVGQAAGRLGLDLRAIENLPNNMTIAQAASQGIKLNGGLPSSMTLGDARRIMNSAQTGMAAFDANAGMAVFNRIVSPQISNLINLPAGLNAGQAQAMLGSVQNILGTQGNMLGSVGSAVSSASSLLGSSGVLSATDLSAVTSALNANMGGISSIVGQMSSLGGLSSAGVDLNGLRSILGAQGGMLSSLGGSMNLSQISGALTSQLGSLGSLSQSLPLSQVQGLLGNQLGALSGMSGSLSLSSIAGGIDNQLLSNVMGANGVINLTSIQGLDISRLAAQLPTGDLRNVLGSIPGLSSGTISSVLNGSMSLSSIPGINGALANVPNINNILSSKVPGLSSAFSGGGMGGMSGSGSSGGSSTLSTYVVLAFLAAMAPDPRTAKCNPNEFGPHNKPSMAQLCRELRAPFAPLNKLKMRYHNPEEDDKIVFKDGVPEGYSFRDYFKPSDPDQATHMPYPRLWDTGRSIQRSASDQQDPKDDSGQWTTIVGVGHEATPGDSQSSGGDKRDDKAKTQRAKDQRCLFGGWGGNVSMGGVSIQVPDPVTSWTELKLYQARTTRDFGLVCLARYDKTYKTGSTEDRALLGFGADPTQGVIVKTNSDGTTSYSSVGKWMKDNPNSNERIKDILQMRQENFPLAWRGYLSADEDDQRFPNFPGGSAQTFTGLDNAQPGDIIVMPYGASGENSDGKRGLPRVALVTREMDKGNWIKVMESDNGKWPDVCGTTDGWGELKTRYIYKKSVSKEAQNEYERINSIDDCADSHLSQCVAKNWDDLKLYRPTKDIRKGNDGSETKQP